MILLNNFFYFFRIIIFILLGGASLYGYYSYYEFIYNLSYLYFASSFFIMKMQGIIYIYYTYIINIFYTLFLILIIPLLKIIKIIFLIIKIMLIILVNIIPSLKFLIAFIFNIIIFLVDLITHNYAFIWGDNLFKEYYNIENYGKKIIFFCDLITSIIVYFLYILYIPAILLYVLYHCIVGYGVWFYIFFELPFIRVIPVLIYLGLIRVFEFIMELVYEEIYFFSWIILFLVPYTFFLIYREYLDDRIYFKMDSYTYEYNNPDSKEVMARHTNAGHIYREIVVILVSSYFLIISLFKLIFLKLGIILCLKYIPAILLYILFFIIYFSIIYFILDILISYKDFLKKKIFELLLKVQEDYNENMYPLYPPIKDFFTKKRTFKINYDILK